MNKNLKRLRTKVKVKLTILELGFISTALSEIIANWLSDDEDGKNLLEAYKKLYDKIGKEVQS